MGKNMFRRTFHIFCRPSGDQQGMNWRTKLSFIDGWSLANAGSCGNTFLLLLCKLLYKGRLSDKPCLAMCVSSLFCLLAVFNPTGDKNHFKVVCFFNVSPFFTHLNRMVFGRLLFSCLDARRLWPWLIWEAQC